MENKRNPNPWNNFTVGRPTHREVQKTEVQLKAERERKRRIADIDENYFDIARNRILEARNELSA